jgi:hypothetical protein
MHLENILKQSADTPNIIFRARVYGIDKQEDLVREVIALANLTHTDTRHIVFGIERQSGFDNVLGLSDDDLQALKIQTRLLAKIIEPEIQLLPIFAQVRGKSIGVLEITACDNPPYVVKDDMSERMRRGECWVLGDSGIRPAVRQDLDRMYAQKGGAGANRVSVGLGDDLSCQVMEILIPDRSQLPSRVAGKKLRQAIQAKRSTRKMLGTDDTGIARLIHARIHGPDIPYNPSGTQTLIQGYHQAQDEHRESDRYYLYEVCAVKLNLIVKNNGSLPLKNAIFELSMPRLNEFDVADCLLSPEGQQRSKQELALLDYPEVKKYSDAIRVRAELGDLSPDKEQAVFECPLRIAVGPEMHAKKIAIRYSLMAEGLQQPVQGRLKLKFCV